MIKALHKVLAITTHVALMKHVLVATSQFNKDTQVQGILSALCL